MKRFQNLHLADRSLFTQYRTLFKTDIPEAQAILNNSQLETKLFRASQFNETTDRIVAIEKYYYDNIPQKLYDLNNQLGDDAKNVKYVGEYNSSETYYFNNIVSYNSELYYCKNKSVSGVIPNVHSNDTPWLYLGLQGSQGRPGLGITLIGAWNTNITYEEKNVVSYGSYLWVASQTSTGQSPALGSEYWVLLIGEEIKKINVEEANLGVGDIYWKEI